MSDIAAIKEKYAGEIAGLADLQSFGNIRVDALESLIDQGRVDL